MTQRAAGRGEMKMKRAMRVPSVLLVGTLVLCAPLVAQDETSRARPTPGFNLFSVEQDVEIGRQSAVAAERQLPLLRDRNVDRYLGSIVSKLAAKAPGARYPYTIKAVNAADINAFSLPGGPMYVNRGLVEAARSEAELAGVLAHEMSHVALRHGDPPGLEGLSRPGRARDTRRAPRERTATARRRS